MKHGWGHPRIAQGLALACALAASGCSDRLDPTSPDFPRKHPAPVITGEVPPPPGVTAFKLKCAQCHTVGGGPLASLWFVVPFTVATGILTGLEFTGNSAVSNYSRVKREVVCFLPISALLLVISGSAFFAVEVLK